MGFNSGFKGLSAETCSSVLIIIIIHVFCCMCAFCLCIKDTSTKPLEFMMILLPGGVKAAGA